MCVTCCCQIAVQRSSIPVDNQRILRHQEDGSQHITSPTSTATTAPEAVHGLREAVGPIAQQHAGRPAAAAATQLAKPTPQHSAKCGTLNKELLQKYAVANTVMITVNDIITVRSLGRHWLRNVNAANISNWLMVATDTATAAYLESLGVSRCFMLPGTEGRAKAASGYKWHDLPWIAATWRNTEASAKVPHTLHARCTHVPHACWILWLPLPSISHSHHQSCSHATSCQPYMLLPTELKLNSTGATTALGPQRHADPPAP